MIGGNQCHLCGARLVSEFTYKYFNKGGLKGQSNHREYRCGTTVSNDDGATWKLGDVGWKCAKMPAVE